jgi:hypothetical protein
MARRRDLLSSTVSAPTTPAAVNPTSSLTIEKLLRAKAILDQAEREGPEPEFIGFEIDGEFRIVNLAFATDRERRRLAQLLGVETIESLTLDSKR